MPVFVQVLEILESPLEFWQVLERSNESENSVRKNGHKINRVEEILVKCEKEVLKKTNK